MSRQELLWPPLPDPMPTIIRPLRHEMLSSYVYRLIRANHAGRAATWQRLGRDGLDNAAARLAALSRVPLNNLLYAIPELYHADEIDTRHLARTAVPYPDESINAQRLSCRRCARAHGAGSESVEVWATHEHHVCLRHRMWIGPGATEPERQLDLTHTPQIVKAQIRQRALIRHRGRPAARRAYLLARDAWHNLHQDARHTREHDRRLSALRAAPGLPADEPHHHAADYPEVVALAAILADPAWLPILRTPGKARYQRLAQHIHDTDEFTPPGPPDFLPDLHLALIAADLRDDTAEPSRPARPRQRRHQQDQPTT